MSDSSIIYANKIVEFVLSSVVFHAFLSSDLSSLAILLPENSRARPVGTDLLPDLATLLSKKLLKSGLLLQKLSFQLFFTLFLSLSILVTVPVTLNCCNGYQALSIF